MTLCPEKAWETLKSFPEQIHNSICRPPRRKDTLVPKRNQEQLQRLNVCTNPSHLKHKYNTRELIISSYRLDTSVFVQVETTDLTMANYIQQHEALFVIAAVRSLRTNKKKKKTILRGTYFNYF